MRIDRARGRLNSQHVPTLGAFQVANDDIGSPGKRQAFTQATYQTGIQRANLIGAFVS